MKKISKTLLLLLMAAASVSLLNSCDDEPTEEKPDPETELTISENITENTTWETGKTYILGGRIAVTNGATLTIKPGVIVKGEAGTGSNATALIIAQGAKIDAQGTAFSPIIFTSIADEIEEGDIASPNLDNDMDGLWGGLIILGKAHISVEGDGLTAQIEGIPASDINGLYGGEDDADNSGILKYVSIRHGGSNIGEGNEINGLTLGGVGSGTQINHIEIVANQDDGIEFFGGSVNVSDVVVWNNGDDAIDCDQAYNGTISNVVIINPGDECFELDGPEGSYINGNFKIMNASVKVEGADGLLDNDDNTNVDIDGLYFFDIEITEKEFKSNSYPDFDQVPTVASNITNLQISVPTSYKDEDENVVTIPSDSVLVDVFFKGASKDAAIIVTSGTVGATTTEFTTWSWAKTSGAF